jgi:hypothetical protein
MALVDTVERTARDLFIRFAFGDDAARQPVRYAPRSDRQSFTGRRPLDQVVDGRTEFDPGTIQRSPVCRACYGSRDHDTERADRGEFHRRRASLPTTGDSGASAPRYRRSRSTWTGRRTSRN